MSPASGVNAVTAAADAGRLPNCGERLCRSHGAVKKFFAGRMKMGAQDKLTVALC